jgi:hypothetical protein
MPLTNPSPKSLQTYTVTNNTVNRAADPTTNNATQNAQVLATLIADLKAAGNIQ